MCTSLPLLLILRFKATLTLLKLNLWCAGKAIVSLANPRRGLRLALPKDRLLGSALVWPNMASCCSGHSSFACCVKWDPIHHVMGFVAQEPNAKAHGASKRGFARMP
ncbi:hypothetical protein TIFTF001_000217 [Ficus carica]|uniref:Secreted protein n=1 Tax=Ficus carica TaxID=3494 RepID=A0AA87Z208_FICCA|nr:hypothetical protein TIFTF001_000217 [Ficus carica]